MTDQSWESVTVFRNVLGETLKPPAKLTIPQWAVRYRELTDKTSDIVGRWSYDVTPYAKEPFDLLSDTDPRYQTIVLLWAAQLGKTDGLLNAIGAAICAGGTTILCLPDKETAMGFVDQRLGDITKPVVNGVPNPVFAKLRLAREADGQRGGGKRGADRALFKEYPGGALKIVGAHARTPLSSTPSRRVLADEVDGYPYTVGKDGSPLALLRRRMQAFPNRKFLICGTPTIKGASAIEYEFASTDQRFFYVPCPHCDERQVLRWTPSVQHPGGVIFNAHNDDPDPHYQCEFCKCLTPEEHKGDMLPKGLWVPGGYEGWSNRIGDREIPRDLRAAGFHLSTLYSPFFTWAEMVTEFRKAEADKRAIQAWLNLNLAELFDPDYVRTEHVTVNADDRTETGFGVGTGAKYEIPDTVAALFTSIDVQGDRLEVGTVGYTVTESSYWIDYVRLEGNPSVPVSNRGSVWRRLAEYLDRKFSSAKGDIPIVGVTVDESYLTDQVHEFVRYMRDKGRLIWSVKGIDDKIGTKYPIWPTKIRPARNRWEIPSYPVGADAAKTLILSRFELTPSDDGCMHFPASQWCDDSFFRGLLSERKIETMKGRTITREWRKIYKRNEPLDLACYALAALRGWQSQGHTLTATLALRQAPGHTPNARQSFVGAPRGWINARR